MKREKRISLVGVAFAALLLLVLAFLVRLTLHRSPEVTLPAFDETESGGDVISDTQQEAIRRVEVTPETVQRVIERLARPERYSRTMTLERYWADGSGTATAAVQIAGGWTRVDLAEGAGEVRHVITGDGQSWIWYGDSGSVFTAAAALSADEEQNIPTYEDILLLDADAVAVADYRALEGVNCIYVETAPDASGYAGRWWVSVETGLLVAAERARGESVVYRMSGLDVQLGDPGPQAFVLPDGTVLFREAEDETEDTENES